jgi:hypothetical protein
VADRGEEVGGEANPRARGRLEPPGNADAVPLERPQVDVEPVGAPGELQGRLTAAGLDVGYVRCALG